MSERMHLVVAAPAEVRRDFRRNLPWFLGLLLLTLVYVAGSASIIRLWEQWGFWRASYFTVINVTTVGFGDVVPLTEGGKVIAGVNAFAGLLFVGALVAVVALAFQPTSWSATLSAAAEPSDPDERPARDDEHVERGAAELLDGLARLIRAAGAPDDQRTGKGRVHIHVLGHGPRHAEIEVFVRVEAG